jgi:hypothetical protein
MTKSKKNDTEQLKEDLAVARVDLRTMHTLATNALRVSKNAGDLAHYEEYHTSVKAAYGGLSKWLEQQEEDTSTFDPRGWNNAKLTTLLPIKERLQELLEMVNKAVDQAEKRKQAKSKNNEVAEP